MIIPTPVGRSTSGRRRDQQTESTRRGWPARPTRSGRIKFMRRSSGRRLETRNAFRGDAAVDIVVMTTHPTLLCNYCCAMQISALSAWRLVNCLSRVRPDSHFGSTSASRSMTSGPILSGLDPPASSTYFIVFVSDFKCIKFRFHFLYRFSSFYTYNQPLIPYLPDNFT